LLSISILSLACGLVSGVAFEEMFAGRVWACPLTAGWSAVWIGSSAGADSDPQE